MKSLVGALAYALHLCITESAGLVEQFFKTQGGRPAESGKDGVFHGGCSIPSHWHY